MLQVKLRMQMLSGQAAPRGCVSVALDMGRREGLRTRQRPASPQPPLPAGPDVVGVRSGGLAGTFFRGSTPALASAFAENTVLFAAHGALGRLLQPDASSSPLQGLALSCAQHGMAGFASSTAICGPEVVKVQLQNSSRPMSSRAAIDARRPSPPSPRPTLRGPAESLLHVCTGKV